jgi:hypothetical protein
VINILTSYIIDQENHSSSIEERKSYVNISWKAPEEGWFSLNTDGAAKISSRCAGCGGVIRDDSGRWICGFSKFLGNTTADMTEIWGLYEGLCVARKCGIEKLEIQMDSSIVIQGLSHGRVALLEEHL